MTRLAQSGTSPKDIDHRPATRFAPSLAELALREMPTRELLAELERWRWWAIREDLQYPEESRAYCEYQVGIILAELEHRKRLLDAHRGDPLAPRWPRRDADLKRRVEAVKATWPIARFCSFMLNLDLAATGTGRWKARCPLPEHEDKSPSFVVYGDTNTWHCFGCGESGDTIALVQRLRNLRFYDALDLLERLEGGVG